MRLCVKSSQINYQRNRTEQKIFPSLMVEAVDALQTLFRAPDPWFRVKARSRRSRPDQVDFWEGVLHLLYNKICLKMIDHGSRSTWGPGPSGSGFRAQNFCFINFFPSLTVEAVDALQTLFRAPLTTGVHPGGQNIASL
jgi:hypothetical protein